MSPKDRCGGCSYSHGEVDVLGDKNVGGLDRSRKIGAMRNGERT